MKNDKYWELRAVKLMYGLMDQAEAEADRIGMRNTERFLAMRYRKHWNNSRI